MKGLAASAELEAHIGKCKSRLEVLIEESRAQATVRLRLTSMVDNIAAATERVNAHLGRLVIAPPRPVCLVRPSVPDIREIIRNLQRKFLADTIHLRVGIGHIFLDGARRDNPIDDAHLDGIDLALAVPGREPCMGITNLPIEVIDLLLAQKLWGAEHPWARLRPDEESLIALIINPERMAVYS